MPGITKNNPPNRTPRQGISMETNHGLCLNLCNIGINFLLIEQIIGSRGINLF